MDGWTETRIAMAKKMWLAGQSASEISREIGGGLSRNAVIGKITRMGLGGRVQAAKPTMARPARPVRPPKPPKVKAERKAIIRSVSPSPVLVGIDYKLTPATEEQKAACRKVGLSVVERVEMGAGVESPSARPFLESKGGCKWPLAGARVCCSPLARGVYCEGHAAVAYLDRSPSLQRITANDDLIAKAADYLTRFERADTPSRTARWRAANDATPTPWDSARAAA